MTSKNLFIKCLNKSMKSRLWTIALVGLLFFFTYPVAAAVFSQRYWYVDNFDRYTRDMSEWLSFGNPWLIFVVILSSIICGMGSFGYLNSKSKVDFYHSLPIKREKLYLINYIVGVLVFAVPFGIMLFSGTVISMVYGALARTVVQVAIWCFVLTMVYYLLMYSVVIIAVMMTGNRVIAGLGVMVFNFVVPLIASIFSGYYMEFFMTWYYGSELRFSWLYRISAMTVYARQARLYNEGVMRQGTNVAALLITLILAVLGCVLYRKRPSEAAGKAMAFNITKPVVRVLLVILSALSFALFWWSVQGAIGWGIFGILTGGIICHCVVEIIYHFEFKKLFSHKWQLVGCLVISLLVFCGFRYDIFGYDSYLPNVSQIKNAAIDVPLLNDWTSYGSVGQYDDGRYYWESESDRDWVLEHMKDVDPQTILKIAEAGIEKSKMLRSNGEFYGSGYPVSICYTLNSGRDIYRRYDVYFEDFKAVLGDLYIQPQYKASIYPVMSWSADTIAEIRYRENGPEKRFDSWSDAEKEELFTAYCKDLAGLSLEQLETELPIGIIRFVTDEEMPALAQEAKEKRQAELDNTSYYNPMQFEERNFYPIYASFEDTCRILKKHGVEPGSSLTQGNTKSYRVTFYGHDYTGYEYEYDWYAKEGYKEIIIDDEEQIKALDAVAVSNGLCYYNPICELAEMDLIAYKEEGSATVEVGVVIPAKQVPDFLAAAGVAESSARKGE